MSHQALCFFPSNLSYSRKNISAVSADYKELELPKKGESMLEENVNEHLKAKHLFRKKKALKEESDPKQVCSTLDLHRDKHFYKK